MLKIPFRPWPMYTREEASAVQRVLMSNRVNYWTGTEGIEFEKEFALWAGTKYAVALANGTVALDAALKALGIGAGDEVLVTPRTFIASVSCIVNSGAKPVFVDVDRDSQNITAEGCRRVLSPRTKAIICVHLAGWPCDMDAIMMLAEEHGLYVVEDCAQAHGARYKGRSVGSIGHVGAWSFCQDKIMTTGGEGGMVTTNDRKLWVRMWSYKDHGKCWDAVHDKHQQSGFRWLHGSFGTNWRMTEMQAVIGRIQLKRMPEWHDRRAENAKRFAMVLADYAAVRVPMPPIEFKHAWYKFYVFVRPEGLAVGWSRDRIMEEINAAGVPCYVGSCSEVYLEKAFDGTGFLPSNRLLMAKQLGETSLMFLVHPTLTPAEIKKSCSVLNMVFARASR